MRKIFCSMALMAAAGCLFGQEKVTITADLKEMKPGAWLYCNAAASDHRTDSVRTEEGGFKITMTLPPDGGDVYMMHIGGDYQPGSYAVIYLDKGNIQITGNGPMLENAVFTGGAGNTDYNVFNAWLKEQPGVTGDSLRMAATAEWVRTHNSSPVSAHIISSRLQDMEPSKQAALLNSLTPEAKRNWEASRLAGRLADRLRADTLIAVGRPAPGFTQQDTAGRPVSLKDFRGKYVLVDFWASWCVPCRAENPNVVAMYKKYRSRNFTVLSVSLDQKGAKKAWMDAIHKDHLHWTNVSDLQFWNNAVARLYDIQGVPANILVAPDGIIVGKDLRREVLVKKLGELLPAASSIVLEPFNSLPKEIDGCSETFSLKDKPLKDKKYIWITDMQGLAMIKVKGKVIRLHRTKDIAISEKRHKEVYEGDGYLITVHTTEVRPIGDEGAYMTGTLEVKNGNETATFTIHGEGGC